MKYSHNNRFERIFANNDNIREKELEDILVKTSKVSNKHSFESVSKDTTIPVRNRKEFYTNVPKMKPEQLNKIIKEV